MEINLVQFTKKVRFNFFFFIYNQDWLSGGAIGCNIIFNASLFCKFFSFSALLVKVNLKKNTLIFDYGQSNFELFVPVHIPGYLGNDLTSQTYFLKKTFNQVIGLVF